MIVSKILMVILDFKSAIASNIQVRELEYCLLKHFLADGHVLKSRGPSRGNLKLFFASSRE